MVLVDGWVPPPLGRFRTFPYRYRALYAAQDERQRDTTVVLVAPINQLKGEIGTKKVHLQYILILEGLYIIV